MFEKIKNLFFDRKRSEEEYKIVIRVLERCNLRSYPYVPTKEVDAIGDKRAYDYNDLNKLPDFVRRLKEQNGMLQQEVITYKNHVENVDSVIDTLIDNIEKRYDVKKRIEETGE